MNLALMCVLFGCLEVSESSRKNISLNLLRFILFQVLVCVSNFMSPNLVFTLSFPFSLCISPSFSWQTNKRGHSLYLLVMNKKSKSLNVFSSSFL